jgi:hypothetical protein
MAAMSELQVAHDVTSTAPLAVTAPGLVLGAFEAAIGRREARVEPKQAEWQHMG